MASLDILSKIHAAGITLHPLPDGRLRAAPRDRLTDELRAMIIENRAEILAALDRQHRAQELAVQLRLYADRNGFSQEDFDEALQVAVASDLDGWLAYINGANETRH